MNKNKRNLRYKNTAFKYLKFYDMINIHIKKDTSSFLNYVKIFFIKFEVYTTSFFYKVYYYTYYVILLKFTPKLKKSCLFVKNIDSTISQNL